MPGSGALNYNHPSGRGIVANWAIDHTPNVEWFDDFLGDTINLDMWTTAADTGCTVAAVSVAAGGMVRLSTDATDDDRVDMGGPLIFLPSNGAIWAEARIKCDVVTTVGINFGMCDAATQASQVLAFAISTTTWTTTPVDGVAWAYDTDATTDIWRGIGVKANTDTAAVTSVVPVAATYDKLGIAISTGGHAGFFHNNVLKGSVQNATTATTPLAPYIGVINRSGAIHLLDVDYVRVVQYLNR